MDELCLTSYFLIDLTTPLTGYSKEIFDYQIGIHNVATMW